MSRHPQDLDCKVYLGDLSRETNEKDVERACTYYGPLKSVWVARNPAGFSFVEFEDPRDAEDAVNGLDGSTLNGVRIRVEHSTGKIRPKPWLRGGRSGGGGGRGGRRPFNPDDKCYQCGDRGHYAYDCQRYGRRGGSRRFSRSRSRSRSRGRRSYSRGRKSYSRSRSRSRDRRGTGHDRKRRDSRDRYSRDRSSRERYPSRSPPARSRSRSRSPPRNDD